MDDALRRTIEGSVSGGFGALRMRSRSIDRLNLSIGRSYGVEVGGGAVVCA